MCENFSKFMKEKKNDSNNNYKWKNKYHWMRHRRILSSEYPSNPPPPVIITPSIDKFGCLHRIYWNSKQCFLVPFSLSIYIQLIFLCGAFFCHDQNNFIFSEFSHSSIGTHFSISFFLRFMELFSSYRSLSSFVFRVLRVQMWMVVVYFFCHFHRCVLSQE